MIDHKDVTRLLMNMDKDTPALRTPICLPVDD